MEAFAGMNGTATSAEGRVDSIYLKQQSSGKPGCCAVLPKIARLRCIAWADFEFNLYGLGLCAQPLLIDRHRTSTPAAPGGTADQRRGCKRTHARGDGMALAWL